MSIGMDRCRSECVSISGTEAMILDLYVDGILIIGSNEQKINELKWELQLIF